MSAVSLSGTNSLHGDLYEFNRNDVTSAINYFDTQSDGLSRNQLATLEGPYIYRISTMAITGPSLFSRAGDKAGSDAF